jgi:hypothetical protein
MLNTKKFNDISLVGLSDLYIIVGVYNPLPFGRGMAEDILTVEEDVALFLSTLFLPASNIENINVKETVSVLILKSEEFLWGTTLVSSGGTLNNSANATDRKFNGAVCDWLSNGNRTLTWTVVDNTVETVMTFISKVIFQFRFRADTAIVDDTVAIQTYDGTTWTTRATFAVGNQPPTSLLTFAYDVTTLLNTIVKINGGQFRINYSRASNPADVTLYVDEGVFIVQRLWISVKDDIVIYDVPSILVSPNCVVFEGIGISDVLVLVVDPLLLSVLEPFYCTVTEHTDIIDLVVEVGIVMDAINALDNASAHISLLNVNLYDGNIIVSEVVSAYIDKQNLSVVDSISITDSINTYQEISIQDGDTISIVEYAVADVKSYSESVSSYDDIGVADETTVVISVLNVAQENSIAIAEATSIVMSALNVDRVDTLTITEQISILDLVIEVGIVDEAIGIVDEVVMVLSEINIVVSETVLISEQSDVYLSGYSIEVYDVITTIENVQVIKYSMSYDFVVTDDIGLLEVTDLIIGGLNADVFDGISVTEFVQTLKPYLYIDNHEDVSAIENISVVRTSVPDVSITIDEVVAVMESGAVTLMLPADIDIDNYTVIAIDESAIIVILAVPELNADSSDDVVIAEDGILSVLLPEDIEITATDVVSSAEAILIFKFGTELDVMDALFVNEWTGFEFDLWCVESSDDIIIAEQAEILIDVLFVTITDDVVVTSVVVIYASLIDEVYCVDTVNISDDVNIALSDMFVDVADDVTTSEDLEQRIEFLVIISHESVGVTSDIHVAFSVLYLNVVDPFGVLITEHIDIIDLVVEVGVVADKVEHVHSWAFLSLDVLVPFAPDMPDTFVQHIVSEYVAVSLSIAVRVSDSVSASEQAQAYESAGISVSDYIAVQEIVLIVRDPQCAVVDTVVIAENIAVAESSAPVTLSISVFDQSAISDSKTLYLDKLFLSVLGQIAVSEYFNLIDLVVEIPLLTDSATVAETVNLSVAYVSILSLSVFDSIVWLGDFYTFGLDPLAVAVYNSVAIAEQAMVFDIIVEMGVVEHIVVVEFVSVPAPFEIGDIACQGSDDITVDEFAHAYPVTLSFLVNETINVVEILTGEISSLWMLVVAVIAVSENINVDIEKNLEIYDSVAIIESAYLIMEGFIPRPPIIFDYHRYPTDSVTFEYDSRTITLPY